MRQLPTSARSIRLENSSLLKRRWRLMQTGELDDPKVMNRLFPGQRQLLEILGVLTEDEVGRLADCGTPLYGLQFRCTEYSLQACADYPLRDSLDIAAASESFLALAARLDAIRTSVQQACLIFNMTGNQASWLSRFCPQELHLLARDPSMVLTPVASTEYFRAAATRSLTSVERTVLGSISRRKCAAVLL
jgi:hypothetical protein